MSTSASKRRQIALKPANNWLERDRPRLEAKSDDAPKPMQFRHRVGRPGKSG